MVQLVSLWSALDMRRRVLVIGASLSMFVTILVLGRMAASPSMALLYSGLDAAASGEVIAVLDARGVAYRIEGNSIHVPADQRDALRLSLAAEGLPAQGGAGYELLDTLSGFGTTAQMFDAAWSRAVEGELVRTILSNPQIRGARVHIARGTDRPFSTSAEPSASVFVTSVAGVTTDEARALRHLVAAAVTGLRPDRVEVIDTVNGLIPVETAGPISGMQSERSEEIRRNIERLLAARVGPGRAVVEVAVDFVTESESLSERRIDPQGRVVASSETETVTGSENAGGGEVTVASNLPDGDAAEAEGNTSRNEESRERIDYELSETRREVTRAPGDIRRLTVAVLVDGLRVVGEDGSTTWQERSTEEMTALRELVASAAGIDEARGDVLTLKSLELVPVEDVMTETGAGLGLDLTRLAALALLGAVALAIGLFVLRPALRPAPVLDESLPRRDGPIGLPLSGPVLTGEIADGFPQADLPVIGPDASEGAVALAGDDPVARLRRLIGERRQESMEIIKVWMDADGGKA